MQKQLKLVLLALCCTAPLSAQNNNTSGQTTSDANEAAFTFTEAQLGEDDNVNQNVTILNSSSNVYASGVGYLFSPVRFRYRAFNQKYNEIYINGAPVNDVERGQFAFSSIGGLNQMTRNVDFSLPFETNNFGMTAMGGSNNYNFRSGAMSTGQRISLGGANRSYTLRGMYTYNSGFNNKGWAYSANVTYRWAKRGYVEGTFYNALSYFVGVQKLLGNHSLSFATWGNPTERASQGAATAESYWIANDYQYNPYWGYQNGKVRNSRVVTDFAPSALITWDWTINNKTKLVTTLLGKYSMYKSTKLNYNNSDNPAPDYYKVLPSNFYDVWGSNARYQTAAAYADWKTAYEWLSGSKANRQINWDRLIAANHNVNAVNADAMYYVQARHNNNLYLTLASALTKQVAKQSTLNLGFTVTGNKGMHYQTMDDLLGANYFHNVNNYAIGTYAKNSDAVQYDLNHPNALVKEGDKFGYDYDINVLCGNVWTNYTETFGIAHYSIAAKIGYDAMNRDGKMRNGLFADNSYGKSKTARFVTGGFKVASSFDFGKGHVVSLGLGYELKAPNANVAFQAPEMNNDFALGLKNERVFSSELAYQLKTPWLNVNLSSYYSRVDNATEWTCFYFDDINSFSYNSITGLAKEYYGAELGAKMKLTSFLDLKVIGSISEAKNISNANVIYLNATEGKPYQDRAYIKNMRESGTPLTAASLGLSYHQSGWFVDLNGNYYDRIYLGYSPYYRYAKSMTKAGLVDNEGNYMVSPQDKGKGGFMLDGSIGRNIRLKKGSLSINLMVTNILNNQKIITGGYEQSRSDYSTNQTTGVASQRSYSFSKNPKVFHAWGTNGMLQIGYRF
ncbi:TonB-dependent receptor [Prevotella sp. A2931]|uniref:TonB-dependent receptor n=1 Tax=Prevotella illustrans TaxID=2800387 RepID=A0ABS3M404_9BACT|nr:MULTISPECIES: TonB-dependent receptor [Prevotella]MBO1362921.1 TonB-dependent receptor [Prevotella illustrans]PTL27173.1 TonB-dependent receptor [Prevotella sp. oral taxon 820]